MGDGDLVDRIDELVRPACVVCERPLPDDCPSDDFCGPEHQQEWTARANGTDDLADYVEAADALDDAMLVHGDTVGGVGWEEYDGEEVSRPYGSLPDGGARRRHVLGRTGSWLLVVVAPVLVVGGLVVATVGSSWLSAVVPACLGVASAVWRIRSPVPSRAAPGPPRDRRRRRGWAVASAIVPMMVLPFVAFLTLAGTTVVFARCSTSVLACGGGLVGLLSLATAALGVVFFVDTVRGGGGRAAGLTWLAVTAALVLMVVLAAVDVALG